MFTRGSTIFSAINDGNQRQWLMEIEQIRTEPMKERARKKRPERAE